MKDYWSVRNKIYCTLTSKSLYKIFPFGYLYFKIRIMIGNHHAFNYFSIVYNKRSTRFLFHPDKYKITSLFQLKEYLTRNAAEHNYMLK